MIYITYLRHFGPLSDTLLEFLRKLYTSYRLMTQDAQLKNLLSDSMKRLESTLNTGAVQSRKESVHKITRKEI